MASIRINDSKFFAQLKKIDKGLIDMSQLFRNIAELELSQTRLRFKKQVTPDGKPWEDPFTIRKGKGPETGSGRFSSKRGWDYVQASNYHATPPGYRFFDKAKGDKILRDTGTLYNSIQPYWDQKRAIVGTNISYAEKHQKGIGVKQREFLGINQKTRNNIDKSIQALLKGLL